MMRQRILGYIGQEIQFLTKDEDLRQELWLHILEGNTIFSLESHLQELMNKQRLMKEMENTYGFKTKL